MTFLVCLLLLAPAAWAIDAPDSVWVESIETGGLVTLGFPAVEDATEYWIFRLIWVATGEENGELVELDEPESAWVFWGSFVPETVQDTLLVKVILLDEPTPDDQLAIVSVGVDENGNEVHSDRAVVSLALNIPTSVQPISWGQLKAE